MGSCNILCEEEPPVPNLGVSLFPVRALGGRGMGSGGVDGQNWKNIEDLISFKEPTRDKD